MIVRRCSNMESKKAEENTAKWKIAEGEWRDWGHYMSKKQEKLWVQFECGKAFEPKISDVFAGVSIFVNGFTVPPADELRRLMQQHGGEYHVYETSRTTHVIASNLCYAKLVRVKPADKIVKPEWITDSIQVGRLLPEDDYLLVKGQDNGNLLKFFNQSTSVNGNRHGDVEVNNGGNGAMEGISRTKVSESASGHDGTTSRNRNCDSVVIPEFIGQSTSDERPSTSFEKPKESASISSKLPYKAGDPNFLKEYYSRSRLHFISTWAQEMKSFVKKLKADAGSSAFVGLEKLRKYVAEKRNSQGHRRGPLSASPPLASSHESLSSVFMHLDMDCFFVSVGLRKRPDLRGQPVAVAHSSGVKGKSTTTTTGAVIEDPSGNEKFSSCSDIASCSYEARSCGVRNGMWLGDAKKMCPALRIIPYDFEEYHAVSQKLYRIVASYTLQIEPVSCDEVYVDISSLCEDTGASPLDVAAVIRRDIYEQCECPSSAGLGPNMLVARLATKKAKPNGQYFVMEDEVSSFMVGQKVADIPGVGHEGQKKFESLNVETCEQLWSVPVSTLRQLFGAKTADQMYNFSKGIDARKVKGDAMRKSISCDMNYGIRFSENKEVHKFLSDFAGEIAKRLKSHQVKGRMIILKLLIRSPDAPVEPPKFLGTGRCDAVSRSTTLLAATDDPGIIAKECIGLIDHIAPVVPDLRGIGISIQKLESTAAVLADVGAGSILQFVKGAMKRRHDNVMARPQGIEKDDPVDMSLDGEKSSNCATSTATSGPASMSKGTNSAKPISVASESVKSKLSGEKDDPAPKQSRQPTLYGQDDNEVIEKLIVEWAGSEEPHPTDVAMVSNYFVDLIDALELFRIRSLLHTLRRHITRRSDPDWLRAYEAVVSDVQHAMRQRYGAPLLFDTDDYI